MTAEWSWKITNLVMESHGKVMEFHFQGFVGTLALPQPKLLFCFRYEDDEDDYYNVKPQRVDPMMGYENFEVRYTRSPEYYTHHRHHSPPPHVVIILVIIMITLIKIWFFISYGVKRSLYILLLALTSEVSPYIC